MAFARRFIVCILPALLVPACRSEQNGAFRVGYLPNLTQAQALVGAHDGTFQRTMAPTEVELRPFASGPAAIEALVGGSLDAAYVGATPSIIAFVRSEGQVRVLSGAVSGGAVFVAREGVREDQLAGKTLAAPQIGNTQDVALRSWLLARGLRPDRDVRVLPLANAEIVNLFRRGQLDGAWVPEPYGAFLVHEAGGHIVVDERELWPNRRFPTTLLVVSERAMRERPGDVRALVAAHQSLTHRWKADPEAFARAANEAFSALTGRALPEPVIRDAFSRLEPTLDPMRAALEENARRMVALGYLERADLSSLVVSPRSLGPAPAVR